MKTATEALAHRKKYFDELNKKMAEKGISGWLTEKQFMKIWIKAGKVIYKSNRG